MRGEGGQKPWEVGVKRMRVLICREVRNTIYIITMKISQIIRSLFRDRLNTSVIIISLAVGIACINLIILFINREISTDDFQKNGSYLYLLKCDDPFNKGSKMFACRLGGAEYMKENFAQVEDYCRINRIGVQKLIVNGQAYYDKPAVFEASANFFSFFTFKLLTNNPTSVLETKDGIAISDELAIKYFGESLPIGQIITLISGKTKSDFVIKGVFRKPTDNTQLSFDIVKYENESESFAFLLLKPNANPAELEKIFDKEKEKIPNINAGTPGKYYLESFKQAYFDTTQNGPLGPIRDKSDLWIALIIGLLIISVASFNYLGLINNKLQEKAQEFNIRRINGGSKFRLIAEFNLENLIVIIIAVALSFEIMSWIMPLFNELTASNINFGHILHLYNLFIITGVIIFLLLLTLVLSYIRITLLTIGSNSKVWVDNRTKTFRIPIFNVSQLTVTLILLACSFIILKQINYITNKDIGLDKEVIEIKIPNQYMQMAKVFKEEIQKVPAIDLVSLTTASPLLEFWKVLYSYSENGEEKQYTTALFPGDENFISTLGIRLIDGRNFSGNMASDKNNCIINESFVRKFPGKYLIGEKLPGDNNLIIIGIVKDFHYSGLKNKIDPGVITFNNSGSHLLVKPFPGQLPAGRQAIKETWQKLIPDYPINIESVRERFEWYHRENSNYLRLIGSCCLISLFLSMIGLFAISYNSSRKRTKEIGIRKINGATINEVLYLFNKDFIIWLVFAFLIATPVAWYAMHKWLENYVYKTDMGWWIFVLAGILSMAITLLTVSWQSWCAATRNPVEALRYE
jgi:putative ABC transport system permease protein